MVSMSVVPYIFSLALIVLVDAAGYADRDPQTPSCQGFDVISNGTQPLPSQNLIISTGVVCDQSPGNFTPCEVLNGSFPTTYDIIMYPNGSRVPDDYAVGYGLCNATGDFGTLWGEGYRAVENQTVTFKNGTSGYVIYTPVYRCIIGRVQGCPFAASIANDTKVSACYPENTDRSVSIETAPGHVRNIPILAGSRSINETSAELAAKLTQIPNNDPPHGGPSVGAGTGLSSARIGLGAL
ncbi:hypothetical protein KCU81_g9858, partial [Aureobasidium melanogenum]|uniref:Uncharacterized protein n=1 Tax=Aureobasidium melanogenum (strain CBS 110374) TaxID=1043003 RepID=A0A074VBJ0_AURM1